MLLTFLSRKGNLLLAAFVSVVILRTGGSVDDRFAFPASEQELSGEGTPQSA
jgi:hypothetical protein